MKRRLWLPFVAVLLGSSVAVLGSGSGQPSLPSCLQDDYGNQYTNLFFYPPTGVLIGTVQSVQCPNDALTMLGSGVINKANGSFLQLTVADNTGPGAVCVPIYQLSGVYPHAEWIYPDSVGGLQFKWAECSANTAARPYTGKGGALGVQK
jgi:hypothetical protein